MNPPSFYGSKVEKHPQEFVDEIYKTLYAIGLTTSEKAELDTYQIKEVDQTWYVQWRDNGLLRNGPLTWEVFKMTFLDRFIPRERRKLKW